MQTSTANRNRGFALVVIFFAAAVAVGVIRWFTNHIALDASFLLIMLFGAAAAFTYLKVAGVHAAREQRAAQEQQQQQQQQETGHTAVITPITAAGRHDAA